MKTKPIKAGDKMSEIAKRYGVDFGNDNVLEVTEFLKKKGYKSLANLLKGVK